ncbi:MAG: translational machinery protein [Gammaproteobacteria bacterium]
MTVHYHAIVWIDHHEARVFHFNDEGFERVLVHSSRPTLHLHHKAHEIGSGHAPEDQTYFHHVVSALDGAGAVLVVGPSNAKHELIKHIEHHDPKLKERIAGVETLDHPTDGEVVAHGRKFFKADDRMHSQRAS